MFCIRKLSLRSMIEFGSIGQGATFPQTFILIANGGEILPKDLKFKGYYAFTRFDVTAFKNVQALTH